LRGAPGPVHPGTIDPRPSDGSDQTISGVIGDPNLRICLYGGFVEDLTSLVTEYPPHIVT
jgi:hypothetical protein